jgi:serine phosphatase RsbU (regulator of sigma subunit)/anti-sigma regulatory factor (Ser/Thr protein kinase)
VARPFGTDPEVQAAFLHAFTLALSDALTVDDVARVAVTRAGQLPAVGRVGLALRQAGGRELSFVSSDQDAMTPTRVGWCSIDAFADVPLTRAMRLRRPQCFRTWEALDAEFPQMSERQRELGTRAMAAIPLVDDGESIGGLMLAYDEPAAFGGGDIAFFDSLGALLTKAIRRAQAYQVQHSTAEQLQRSLLPRSLNDLDGLSFGASYKPGDAGVSVGGDWYDVLELADGSVLVSLGDVMGKGIAAAVVMSEVRAAMRAYSLLDPRPEVVLARLDHVVSTLAAPEQIVTVAYGIFSPDRRTVTLATAGHPPPLLVPAVGEPVLLDAAPGPALGMGAGPWPSHEVAITPGSTLLFYSDGLVETRAIDLFTGIDRLRDRIAAMPRRRRTPRELAATLGQLVETGAASDDVTVLATAVTPSLAPLSATLELPAEPSAAASARGFMRQTLTAWAVPAFVIDNAELCVSELVTNAVIHSNSPSEVTVRLDDEYLLVLVRDRGGAGAVQLAQDYQPMNVSGRGLTLVDARASAWNAEDTAEGTTVWFEIELEPSEAAVPHAAGAQPPQPA